MTMRLDGGISAVVDDDLARAAAESAQVCVRPLVRSVHDRVTGATHIVPIPCGSTREAVCPSCADKARRLRMHQCREGWHRTDEPRVPPTPETPLPDGWEDLDRWADDGGFIPDADRVKLPTARLEPAADGERQTRSTRRLDDFPDLPKQHMTDATVGQTFTDPKTGRVFRPSMFLTLTLPSYGKVAEGGIPRNPDRYDYRRAALDALTFSRLVDRFWQNLRRCAGYKVQYFATIEAQKRLAPHLHAAVRGSIPRTVIKAVGAATYYAAWWPPIDTVRYDDVLPVWDAETAAYLDPTTGEGLPDWKQATAHLENPVHVATLGTQLDVKGLIGGTKDSERTVRYLCKYLTKSISGTYTATDDDGEQEPTAHARAYERHIDRLHAEVRWLPCGPTCANWLRYGVQPKDPGPGLIPGRCPSPAHDRENLGLGGRRVLVSRQWTGKTLTEHKADRSAVVRQALAAAGFEPEDANRLAADQATDDGHARFVWRAPEAGTFTYPAVIAASLRQAIAWRRQYDAAKHALGRPPGPVDNRSATTTPTAA
ncbi:replication initiation protein [Antribacter sp. KLBMP9083]|uniref:Replication initiation protein n=1 Tax=Antribacter soli TaxID=2910976 RepID=A0AA41QE29_9MICO|nr:replication initiator [Antribacter soli]MCF4121743.1 replication initiation protein [Antribacter soli]